MQHVSDSFVAPVFFALLRAQSAATEQRRGRLIFQKIIILRHCAWASRPHPGHSARRYHVPLALILLARSKWRERKTPICLIFDVTLINLEATVNRDRGWNWTETGELGYFILEVPWSTCFPRTGKLDKNLFQKEQLTHRRITHRKKPPHSETHKQVKRERGD